MNQTLLEKVKQGVIVIVLGAVFAIIPFYFQTGAMTIQNEQTNSEQTKQIEQTQERLRQLEVQKAVDGTEIKQIKESVVRIEKKIDYLIENPKK